MIKLYLDVGDAYTQRHTLYANCGLHVNLWKFWLIPFCFVMRKDHFKQKSLLWPQVPFKLQQEFLKFSDICVSWSSQKTDRETNFLNLEN